MLRRIADILEKFAVGSLLVGVYQQNMAGVACALACGCACLYLTRRLP